MSWSCCCRAQKAKANGKAAAKPKQPTVLVLYASQTGTGEEIARTISTDASQHGFAGKVGLNPPASCSDASTCKDTQLQFDAQLPAFAIPC